MKVKFIQKTFIGTGGIIFTGEDRDVDPDIAVERLVAFRGMDADDAQRRIASQIDRAARRAIATHVIDNSADEAELDRRVGEVWDDLLRLRAEG